MAMASSESDGGEENIYSDHDNADSDEAEAFDCPDEALATAEDHAKHGRHDDALLCFGFALETEDGADDEGHLIVEARYDGRLIARLPASTDAPRFAPSPECDGGSFMPSAAPPLYDPPQCKPPPSPPSLLRATVPMRQGAWHDAAIDISWLGLSLWLDGTPLFDRQPLPTWQPQEHWGSCFRHRCYR